MSVEKYVEAATKAFQKHNYLEGLSQLAKLDTLNVVPDPHPKPHEEYPEPQVNTEVATEIIEKYYPYFETSHYQEFVDSLTPLDSKETIRSLRYLNQALEDSVMVGPEMGNEMLLTFFRALVKTDQNKVRTGIERGIESDLKDENPKSVDIFVRYLENQIEQATGESQSNPSKNQPPPS